MARGSLAAGVATVLALVGGGIAVGKAAEHESVALDYGRVGSTYWAVNVEPALRGGGRYPCIRVSSVYPVDGLYYQGSEFTLCQGGPGAFGARSQPLFVGEPLHDTDGLMVYGVAAPLAARTIELIRENGSAKVVRLHLLNRFQARKTGRRPFRHAVFLIRLSPCVEQIVIRNRAGARLSQSGPGLCEEGWSEEP